MKSFIMPNVPGKKRQLGCRINTRTMTVGHTNERISKIQKELTHWHKARRSFTIKDAANLIGSIEFIPNGTLG